MLPANYFGSFETGLRKLKVEYKVHKIRKIDLILLTDYER